jgi:hypothetical protein
MTKSLTATISVIGNDGMEPSTDTCLEHTTCSDYSCGESSLIALCDSDLPL